MRFLCEQCKAKYQIADEKVAGKTVRMKCRKCGHLIEVKAEVTETSVASKAPQKPQVEESESDDATRVGVDVNAILASHRPQAPQKPAAPRPGAPPQRTGLATSFASQKPVKPAAPARPEGGALAGAFQKTVAKAPSQMEIATSSEWYVAINGVPVGPVRISELRRKAAVGAVTEDSLVWQEGMEEWRPLRTITDLLAIVHEGLTSERPSLVTPAPAQAQAPRQSAPPRPAPTKPEPPRAPPARSNVVPINSRLATAEKLEPDVVADPFAASASTGSDAAKSPISGIDALVAAIPANPPMGITAAAQQAGPTVVIPRKNGPNWIVIGMVVAFGAFGATAGIAVFFNKPPPPQLAPTFVVSTQAAPPTVATGPAIAQAGGTSSAQADPATPHTQGGGGGTVRSSGGSTAGASTQHAVDPSIAALLGGGPGTGPQVGGGGGGGSSNVALTQDEIYRVVQQRSAGVKRTCWERGGSAESNVSVTVHVTITAAGTVQNASSEGNDPIVGKCIENSVRNWQFPVSSGSTDVNIPFKFLRQ